MEENTKNNIAAAGINAGASFANNIISNLWAGHHRRQNYRYNEMAAKKADQRQRAQYMELYSPEAMMKQYAAAGLSPSMMMSGGQAAVGQSSAQGNQSAGIQGPYPSTMPIDPLAAAQMANIIADTKKKEAETINIGADTEFTLTNIIKAAEETENIKMTRKLLELQTTGQQLINEAKKLENDIANANKDEVIKQCQILSEKLQRESDQLYKQNESLDLENNLSRETYQTRVNQYLAEYQQTIALTAKAASDVQLNTQQIQSLIDNVAIAQFDSRTRRMSANEQIRHNDQIVEQWAKENGFTEETIKHEKTKKWLQFTASILDSACKVAGSIISAK